MPANQWLQLHDARMADAGGLGQAGGAGGVDVQGAVRGRRQRAFGLGQGRVAEAGELILEAFLRGHRRRRGRALRRRAVVGIPEPGAGRLLAQKRRKLAPETGADDQVARLHQADGMGQRGPAHMDVEQRDHHAQARESDPDRQVLWGILHEQPDHRAAGQSLLQPPARIAVAALRQFAVAEAALVESTAGASPKRCPPSSMTTGSVRWGCRAMRAVASRARTQSCAGARAAAGRGAPGRIAPLRAGSSWAGVMSRLRV